MSVSPAFGKSLILNTAPMKPITVPTMKRPIAPRAVVPS